jgi:intermediate peptidase
MCCSGLTLTRTCLKNEGILLQQIKAATIKEYRRFHSTHNTLFPLSTCISEKKNKVANSVSADDQHTRNEERDRELRELFDNEPTYHTSSPSNEVGFLITGLFGNDRLATPDGFRELAEESLARSRRLVTIISSADTDTALRDSVRRLDELSDALCSVLDLAEFVRHVHPDRRYVEEAHRAYERLFSFMNTLNTDTGLYQASKRYKF